MIKKLSLKRAMAICAGLLLSFSLIGNTAGDSVIKTSADNSAYEQKLDELEQEQKKLEDEIDIAQKKLDEANDNVEAIKIKCTTVEGMISNYKLQSEKIEKQMAQIDTKLREASVKLEEQTEQIEKSKDEFMDRIRTMYVAGGAQSYTDVLINSSDFYDVLMRVELLKRVAEHDNNQLNSLVEQKKELEATEKAVKETSEKLKSTADTYIKKQNAMLEKQEELEKLQNLAQKKANGLSGKNDQLEEQSRKLAEEYSRISKKAEETTTTKATTKKETTKKETSASSKETSAPSQSTSKETVKTQTETQSPQTTYTTRPAETTTTTPAETQPKEPTSDPTPSTGNSSDIDKVLTYAKSNVGGAYVWAGSSFRATDCSGLVMLSYGQIGISLPHLASAQASYGSTVSYSNMQPGDLIFFGGSSYSSIYHVAIYIGNGLMVHAESTATGIVISDVGNFSQYNNITTIKRILN